MSAAHQITAADPALSVFVTANAGSGKTTTLVNRVARLLLETVRPGEILCVTYTKAAAAEMQARLFETLGEWAVLDDADLAREVARLDESDPAALSGERLSEARRLFARALETPGGLKIQTIHAFCEKLLRRFPLEAGVSPNFTVLETEAAKELSHAARDELARAAGADPDGVVGRAFAHFAGRLAWDDFHALLAMLEAERGKLIDYIDRVDDGRAPGPFVLAGADPDETAESIEAEFLNGLDPTDWSAAALAFAEGSKTEQKLADTLRTCAPPATTLDALKPIFFDSKGLPREGFGTKSAPPGAVAYLSRVQAAYISALERVRAARVAEDTVHALTLARAHAALYEAEKAHAHALDFADLVDLTRRLLTEKADAAWVLYKLDGGVEHVLIDEAQDTAPDQWAVFRALTEEFFAGAGAERRLIEPRLPRTVFAVGDEKQSIYSFQGARPERLRQEAQGYEALVRGAERAFAEVPLDTSFRSTPEVLASVDAAFAGPERTRALVGARGEIATHTPARADQPGSVELWPLFRDPEKVDRDAWSAPVDQEARNSGRKQLAQALAQEIRRQVEAGVAVWDRDPETRAPVPRPAGYGDFLILVRRRDATFEEIIRALKSAGVPVAGADRLKLSSHIVFDDLKAMARFALFPDDDLTLAGLLRSPFCDVPDFGPPDSLYELTETEQRAGRTLWKALRDRADEQPSWRRARDLMQAAIDARGRDPFGFFSLLLNRVDETGRSGRASILDRLGREAEEAIDESLNQVLAAEARGGIDLETCLALLEAADVEVKRELEGPRGEVRVMTVHGAKGLEAPVVILPDTTMRSKPQGPTLMPVALGDPLLDPAAGEGWLMAPGRKDDDCAASRAARQARERRTDEEAMRLLYVALTRARDRIIVMGRACSRPKEGFEAGSWWSVLTETFARLDERVRDVGDGRLRYGPDPQAVPTRSRATETAIAVPAWATTPPAPDPGARYASPSRMEGLRIPAPSPLAGGAGSLGRFRRGDLIHRLLERLPDMAPEGRADAARRMMSRERDLSDEQRQEMIQAALTVLNDPVFAPVFGPGSRAEAALTGSAPELPAGVRVSGRIDRLVITRERVLVVDYKTNRPAPARIEDADPAYVLQLAVYVAVLRRVYPERSVEAALVWTDGPRLMPVPRALMDAALAAR